MRFLSVCCAVAILAGSSFARADEPPERFQSTPILSPRGSLIFFGTLYGAVAAGAGTYDFAASVGASPLIIFPALPVGALLGATTTWLATRGRTYSPAYANAVMAGGTWGGVVGTLGAYAITQRDRVELAS